MIFGVGREAGYFFFLQIKIGTIMSKPFVSLVCLSFSDGGEGVGRRLRHQYL